MSISVPLGPSKRCTSSRAGTMRSGSIQQRDQEKIATSKADAGACAANSSNAAWRSTTRPSSSRGSCSLARVIAGANGSTAVTCSTLSA